MKARSIRAGSNPARSRGAYILYWKFKMNLTCGKVCPIAQFWSYFEAFFMKATAFIFYYFASWEA